MKRIFIAVDIFPNKKLISYFEDLKRILNNRGNRISWVKNDNFHITLKFIGETPQEKIDEITEKLMFLENESAFEIEIYGLGVFPNSYRPRVLWLGINDDNNLKILATKINETLETLGIEKEKKDFVPHLTLGRIKFFKSNDFLKKEIEKSKNIVWQTQKINKVILYQSTLTPQGAIYTPLKIFKLKN